MEVDEDTAEVRVIYFYDTAGLALFDAGVTLRARLVKGDDDDSTSEVPPGRSREYFGGVEAAEGIQTGSRLCRRPGGLLGIAYDAP